jgi:UDP-glucose 4-epimerase
MSGFQRVVVTGGAGFIGSHVVDRLVASGTEVIVVDDLSMGSEANLPNGVRLIKVDLATREAVTRIVDAHPDAVIHCAAQTSVPASFEDPTSDARTNIIGSLTVVEACRLARVAALVYVTTGGALYGRPMTVPWDEQAPISPISPYGISKSIVEAYLALLVPTSLVAVLRLSNVYGPRQGSVGESGVVAAFIQRMRGGLPVVIDGDGEQTRDLLYVADAVDAIEAALHGNVSGTFNIGTGQGTSVNALFKQVALLLGYERPPEFGPPRVGDIRHSALDPTLAAKALGWRAHTALVSGLAETLESSAA